MTVYGPRLYFGPLDTPTAASPDSGCSRATIGEPPTEKEHRMTDLNFIRQTDGGYVAECDGSTGVLRWIITQDKARRRWAIVSIRPDRLQHGSTYTLRQAKEVVNRWHAADLARAASPA